MVKLCEALEEAKRGRGVNNGRIAVFKECVKERTFV
jgi:hypothetical protein